MHLQTKGSPGHPPRPASDITTAEFNSIFSELVQVLQDRKLEAGLRRTEHFIICLDHATVHNEAATLLPQGWQLLPHPPHSPECNKPIEHVHGQMDEKVHSWLLEWRDTHGDSNPTPQQCTDVCRDFFTALPTSKIAADISTLPDTWRAVVAVRGDYIAPRLS
jgi:hypothetical protein